MRGRLIAGVDSSPVRALRAGKLLVACATLALSVAALAVPPALARARARADLKVTSVSTSGLGSPEHVLVKPDGSTAGFIVHVITKNVGRAASRPSLTLLSAVFGGVKEEIALLHIKGLRRGQAQTSTVEIEHPFKHLGFASLRAEANFGRRTPESNRRNNVLQKLHIAFVAQIWRVLDFSNVFVAQGMPKRESNNTPTLRFRFREYLKADEAYVYDVEGGVAGYVSGEVSGGCAVSGSAATAHYPWAQPDSLLRIQQTLSRYRAFVAASNDEPFETTFTCYGNKVPGSKESFMDLTTWGAGDFYVAMSQGATTLEGKAQDKEGLTTWQFKAELPS